MTFLRKSLLLLTAGVVACSEAVPSTPGAEPDGGSPGIGVDAAAPYDAASAPDAKKPTKEDGGLPGDEDGGEIPGDLPVDPATGCFIVDDAPITTRSVLLGAGDGGTVRLETYAEPASLASTFALPDGGAVTKKGTLRFELYKGPRAAFAPGTIDLACASGASCSGSTLYDRKSAQNYGVESGTVTVATAATPVSNELTGSMSTIIFRQLTGAGVLDPGGQCFLIPAATFDTRAPAGTPCTQPEDCGSSSKVCDPKTLTCNVSLCNGDTDCGPSESCLAAGGANGLDPQGKACFSNCSPWSSTCGAGLSCRRRSNTTGVCLHASPTPKTLGEACSLETFVNECNANLACNGVCKQACNHVAANPGCSASERCFASDLCGPVPITSPAAVGSSCSLPAGTTSLPCGDDGKAYRGTCASAPNPFGGPPEPPKCHRLCDPPAPSCPDGTLCQILITTLDHVCK